MSPARIEIGMTKDEVTKILGDPNEKLSLGDIMGMASRAIQLGESDPNEKEFWLYEKAEGTYRLEFLGNTVSTVAEQPE
jgi:hypothetical protein